MEFISLLKYGAIGISLALAVLSFRLLSKEQEEEEERPKMLSSISQYFKLAVFLSVFFGLMELASQIFIKQKVDSSAEIDSLWNKHFGEYKDSTLSQKLNRISGALDKPEININEQEICSAYIQELNQCKKEIGENKEGFYQNIIQLKKQVRLDPDGWVNLKHNVQAKSEIFSSLKKIFVSLGNDYDHLKNEEIIQKWETLKSQWTFEKQSYIFNSDITQLVRIYLDTFAEK